MLAKRIIPCLDVDRGRVVKGIKFVDFKDAGDPVEQARRYDREGADELVFLDITASSDSRGIVRDMVRRVADSVFIPFTVGGGIRTIEDVREILASGADKISINTAAINNPSLITAGAEAFGSQAIVVAIDARRYREQVTGHREQGTGEGGATGGRLLGTGERGEPEDWGQRTGEMEEETGNAEQMLDEGEQKTSGSSPVPCHLSPVLSALSPVPCHLSPVTSPLSWEVYVHGGRTPTGIDVVEWAARAEKLGAGEILLTSMDCDGTRDGYDLALTRAVSEAVSIPVIASGGAGTLVHLAEALDEGKASAVLAASIFHFGEFTIAQAKEFLRGRGLPMRLTNASDQ